MKNLIAIILAGLFGGNLLAQTADQDVASGLNYLAAQDLVHANQQFTNALALSPTHASANALVAVTRLLLVPTTSAGSNFLNSLGYSRAGRNIYNWTSSLPVDIHGDQLLPTNNTAVVVAFYRTNIMPALAASRANLAAITDPNFTLAFTAGETSLQAVTLDYGDILVLRALERAAEFAGYTANAQNGNVVLSQLQTLAKTNGLTVQKFLSLYPSFLTLATAGDLAASQDALTNAIALYFAASDFIRNVRAPGVTTLFNLGDEETNTEAQFRTGLTNFLSSLNGPAKFDAPDPVTINSSVYFSGTKTLRSLLPQFNGNSYTLNTLPDYSFGGILVNEPAYLVEKQLRHVFYSYAGIYAGQVYDLNYNDPNAGNFAVFVGTNQQATVVGDDRDSANDFSGTAGFTQYGGISAQFNVDKNGNWQFDSNRLAGVSGSGSFGKDGSYSGELDFTNGDSVWLNGYQQPALGPFQNAAGNYSGPVKASNGSQVGTIQLVLSASGSMTFCFFQNLVQNDGGQGQIGANNNYTFTSANGATGSGTFNPSTFQFTGNVISSGGTRSSTLSRTAKVPFDLPPAISKNLPSTLTASAGTNLTISLTATGSPPMSYQWYSNDIAIPFATSNVLVVANLQLSSAGTFSVTIDNVAGETNSAVLALTVVPESTPPTCQITSPTSGQQVSNSVYTVTGKATDNAAVSNVLVQINGGGWNPAIPANQWTNWSAQVPLVPGSNTVQAYAVDTSGNVSATSTVLFKYVVSAPLTVQMIGCGTVSPNYSNAFLQVGTAYAMTAVAITNSGFAFTGWTGGTSLPLDSLTNGATVKFTMISNLVLQANFADTNRPALGVTNATTGMLVSNAIYIVKGTATDNVQVVQVNCRLNGAEFTNTSSLNNGSWTDEVTLLPGTNQFQAYAVDSSGNISLTNTVRLVYVVSAVLTVRTNGLGTLTPNDNGALLQLGKSYAITATPAAGFRFTNWTGGTSLPLALMTNGATVQFVMVTNLLLQANFMDTNRPTLTISVPTAGQHMSNALAFVKGTAADNWKVAGVWCQLNSNSWALATSTNGWTNWTTVFKLLAGTNTIRAYAADLAGNLSLTTNVSVLSSNAFKLLLTLTNGHPTGGMTFNLQLSTGLNGHIQVSTNLQDWTALTNFVGTNAAASFRDPAATNGVRFYRAVVP